MGLRNRVAVNRWALEILAGIFIWYLFVTVLLLFCYQNVFDVNSVPYIRRKYETRSKSPESPLCTDRNLVFVGVITTAKFINTRVAAANNTWVKTIPGTVVFFVSGSEEGDMRDIRAPGIEIVVLKEADDAYPPQRKAFLMLRHMYDHYLNGFRFFMRADDDTYIKGAELVTFLHSVKSSDGTPVIGSTGLGMKKDEGRLGLRRDENYCMGGPGMVIPREVLRKVGRRIKFCLKNTFSAEEDVELGRCFKHVANVSCTWAWENLFYHDYRDIKVGFNHSLEDNEIRAALTLHPLKVPTYTYRLHQYLLTLRVQTLYVRLLKLKRDSDAMSHLANDDDVALRPRAMFPASLRPVGEMSEAEASPWVYIVDTLHSPYVENPRMQIPANGATGMNYTAWQIWPKVADKSKNVKQQVFSFRYSRLNRLLGNEYMLTVTKKIWDPETRKDLIENRESYAYRPFGSVEMMEDFRNHRPGDEITNRSRAAADGGDDVRVNMIVSLVGRYAAFLDFMKNFEDQFLKTGQNVSLLVMLYRNKPNDTSSKVISYIERLQKNYSDVSLGTAIMKGDFSRGRALQTSVQRFKDEDLLFFVDVDLALDQSVLLRVRRNTKLNREIYLPIVFSEYDPDSLPRNNSYRLAGNSERAKSPFHSEYGNWRQFGYGILSCYKTDLNGVGGFRMDIKGWGLEDVDLYDKFLHSDLTIFRSVDEGMRHRHHPVVCGKMLSEDQQRMCVGSLVSTIASTESLSDFVYRTPDILNRHQNEEIEVSRITEIERSSNKNEETDVSRVTEVGTSSNKNEEIEVSLLTEVGTSSNSSSE